MSKTARGLTLILFRLLSAILVGGVFLASKSRASGSNASDDFLIYVSNERSGDISVIDPRQGRVSATFPVGKRPRGIHCSPDGRMVYVALSGSPRMGPGADPARSHSQTADKSADGIGAIDTTIHARTKLLRVGSDPEQFALTPDGAFLIVSNEDTASVSVLELATEKIVRRLPVAAEPEGVSVNPSNGEVYVTCEGDGSIHVLDAAANRQIAEFSVGGRPRSVAFSPDGNLAYIPSEGTAALSVVDSHSHRVIETVQLEGENVLPMGAVSSPDGKRIFVTTGRGNQVAAIDAATATVIAMIPVGARPWGIGLDPAGRRLYTANGGSDDVSVIDTQTLKEIARIKVGSGPWGIAIGKRP